MKKILVVEDNLDLCENIHSLLEKENFLVQSVNTGKVALEVFIKMKPDLILCDILLPDISGYSVLKNIKKLKNKLLPIFIFITAKTQREDLRLGMGLGADDYITKPFSKTELIDSINAQFQKRANVITHIENRLVESSNIKRKPDQIDIISSNSENPSNNYEEYLFLKNKDESGFYSIDDIIVIRSLKDYSQLFLKGIKTFIIRRTMIEWENKLSPNKFVRIHKQTLINLKYIQKIEAMSSHRFRVTLSEIEKQFEVSQRYSRKVKKIFK